MKQLIDNNLIISLGLDKLTPEEQEEILISISDVIYSSIVNRAVLELSEKGKIELDHLLATNPDFEQVGEFMHTNIPHIDIIAEEEINNFKNIALKTVQEVTV